MPLPRPIKGKQLLDVISSSFAELNDEDLSLNVEIGEIDKDGDVKASSVCIKLKHTIKCPDNLSPEQGLIFGLSRLLEHPLITELREEEYYFGVSMWIDYEEIKKELTYTENRPHRRRYTDEFLPHFMKLYEIIYENMGASSA